MNKYKLFSGIFLAMLGITIWAGFGFHSAFKEVRIADGWEATAITLVMVLAFVILFASGVALALAALPKKNEVKNGK